MHSLGNCLRNLSRRPWIALLPFLVLYVVLVLVFHKDAMEGDEGRYVFFAENLSQGFYSPRDEINLWNGPGYPLVLVPLVLMGLPYICFTLLNAVFLYLALVITFAELRAVSSEKVAWTFACFLGLYYIAWDELVQILTEPITLLLIALFVASCRRAFQHPVWSRIVVCGMALGYLCLTKVIFGIIVTALIPLMAFLAILFKRQYYLASLKIYLVAFACVLPYLLYTYQLTSKFPYWGNPGGSNFYSMSSPYPGEYGNWIPPSFSLETSRTQPAEVLDLASKYYEKNHKEVIERLKGKTSIEQDEILFQEGWKNIRDHPLKFAQNWIANVSRMFFVFPYSYYRHNMVPLLYILPNSFLLVLGLISVPAGIIMWRLHIPPHSKLLVFNGLCYLGACTLVSAEPRMLYVVLPIILLWFGSTLKPIVEAYWGLFPQRNRKADDIEMR